LQNDNTWNKAPPLPFQFKICFDHEQFAVFSTCSYIHLAYCENQ